MARRQCSEFWWRSRGVRGSVLAVLDYSRGPKSRRFWGRSRQLGAVTAQRDIVQLLDLQAGRTDLFGGECAVLELVPREDELRAGERK